MNFLVDAQLPAALARWLTDRGHPSQHVTDVMMADAKDREIWAIAKKNGWALITKDEDFVHLANLDSEGVPVIWLRVRNCRKRALLDWFAPLLPLILNELARGERVVEVV